MRNDTWKEDEELNQDLEEYARQELKWDEILDFVSKKCPSYNVQLSAWSLLTLFHSLHYFKDIKCIKYEIEQDDLEESVHEEMNVPENLLGYCAMTKKIREIHSQKVLRNLVYAMMEHVDPSGLKKTRWHRETKAKPKGCFCLKGKH